MGWLKQFWCNFQAYQVLFKVGYWGRHCGTAATWETYNPLQSASSTPLPTQLPTNASGKAAADVPSICVCATNMEGSRILALAWLRHRYCEHLGSERGTDDRSLSLSLSLCHSNTYFFIKKKKEWNISELRMRYSIRKLESRVYSQRPTHLSVQAKSHLKRNQKSTTVR